MKADRAVADEALLMALGRLRVALDDSYARASRQMGLTPQQAELLCASMIPAAVGELAERLRCDRSNVSRLVDRGSLRGLIRRRAGEEDGRVTFVELTPEGEQLAHRFLAALESETAALRSTWPNPRKRLAAELMDEISDALEAGKSPPARGPRRKAKRPT